MITMIPWCTNHIEMILIDKRSTGFAILSEVKSVYSAFFFKCTLSRRFFEAIDMILNECVAHLIRYNNSGTKLYTSNEPF